MGLLNIIKSRKQENKKENLQKKVLQDMAAFSEKEGDRYHAFYYSHKAVVDFYENQITDQLTLARNVDDCGNAIQYYETCLHVFQSFEAWCASQNGGMEFYEKHIQLNPDMPSRVERLERRIADAEYLYYTVSPTILQQAKENPGIRQADLCRSFDISRDEVIIEIRRLENAGFIRTEKQGKYVCIYPY